MACQISRILVGAVALLWGTLCTVSAEPAFVLTALGNQLVRFDTATPGVVSAAVVISSLAGGVGERLVGIDFRPRTGSLYALGRASAGATDSLRLYRIDPSNGVATMIGNVPITGIPAASHYAMDFNAAVDRIRIVNSADANLRINPNTGALAGSDTMLSPAGRQVDGLAYDRNTDGASGVTAYAIARDIGALVHLGGPGGTPSPNGGALTTIGALGVAINPGGGLGFDIDETGVARLVCSDATGTTALYVVDLASGVASRVGAIGAGTSSVDGFAVRLDRIFANGFE